LGKGEFLRTLFDREQYIKAEVLLIELQKAKTYDEVKAVFDRINKISKNEVTKK